MREKESERDKEGEREREEKEKERDRARDRKRDTWTHLAKCQKESTQGRLGCFHCPCSVLARKDLRRRIPDRIYTHM